MNTEIRKKNFLNIRKSQRHADTRARETREKLTFQTFPCAWVDTRRGWMATVKRNPFCWWWGKTTQSNALWRKKKNLSLISATFFQNRKKKNPALAHAHSLPTSIVCRFSPFHVYTIGYTFSIQCSQSKEWTRENSSNKAKRHEINLANALGSRIGDKKRTGGGLWHEWTSLKAFNFHLFSFPVQKKMTMEIIFLSINNFSLRSSARTLRFPISAREREIRLKK